MIAGINESKTLTKYICINVDLLKGNVIQINGGTMINVDVSVKHVIHQKKIILEILLHVIVKM